MIRVKQAEVTLTETTLRELLAAVEILRIPDIEFIDDPMPEGDMDEVRKWRELRRRGVILVASEYAPVTFRIEIEKRPHSQESMGYRLV